MYDDKKKVDVIRPRTRTLEAHDSLSNQYIIIIYYSLMHASCTLSFYSVIAQAKYYSLFLYTLQVFMTFLPNKTPKLAIIACLLIVSVVEIEIISAMFA